MIHKNPSCFLGSGPSYWIHHFQFFNSIFSDSATKKPYDNKFQKIRSFFQI